MSELFKVHLLNENGLAKAKELADAFEALWTAIEVIVPQGRELSLVKTKLEEASFFAKKGIAQLPENQK